MSSFFCILSVFIVYFIGPPMSIKQHIFYS
uniref:Uncharacterized protein n=1 Tax=Myoviridae sp. ct9dX1 TaxID=2827665 RepID=A0A8S5TIP1_9CAUD|nr:MAG TPA: hypothetical protein [Myoviridae sp. ct9dX1]